jgi:nucleotide-binding universal stress UspA family protein
MKVILGVDPEGQYLQALKLLARLRFPHLHLIMVHVRPNEDEMDADLLAHAAKFAYALDLHANEYSEEGDAASLLTQLARLENADLIVIGSGEKGPLNALLFGSVGKALMAGWEGSILIAKGYVDSYGSLTALLGYDDSDHSREALQSLVRWHPAGLRHTEVVTVELPLVAEFQDLRLDQEKAIGAAVLEKDETAEMIASRAAQELNAGGLVASAKGLYGDVVRELGKEMDTTLSDLLILPAQRHSLFERLFFGSVSMTEAVKEHHSMLVVR